MKGQTIPQGWYKVDISQFNIKPPKNGGDSLNYVPEFTFPTLDNFKMEHTFNSQAIGNMGPFIAALNGKPLKEIMDSIKGGTLEFDTDTCVGKKIQIKIKHDEYQGRMVNKVDGFLPYDAAVPF